MPKNYLLDNRPETNVLIYLDKKPQRKVILVIANPANKTIKIATTQPTKKSDPNIFQEAVGLLSVILVQMNPFYTPIVIYTNLDLNTDQSKVYTSVDHLVSKIALGGIDLVEVYEIPRIFKNKVVRSLLKYVEKRSRDV